MRIYSHVVRSDTGLAPNPFHGFCTSAVCTPSHKNAQLKEGEWLIGHSTVADEHKLVYAMRILKVLGMNAYFRAREFRRKKPKLNGKPEEQCGDNMYFLNRGGEWRQLPSYFHTSKRDFEKDVGGKGRRVFVARHFYYFGGNRVPIPEHLRSVIHTTQGLKITHDRTLVRGFVEWLESAYQPGVIGKPRDMYDLRMRTGNISSCRAPRWHQTPKKPR